MYIYENGTKNKPIILFLHGNGSNGRMWKDHMNYFAGYHCLAPDFPGFGNSSQQEWVSLEKTTGEIIDLIRQRRNDSPVHIVGLSLGGAVATVLLSKAPELIDHAVVDGA